MVTAGELRSTQEAPLPTQHQQERRQGQAIEGMDGEREELRVGRWVDDQMKREIQLSVRPACTCCFGGPPCEHPELNYSQRDRVYKAGWRNQRLHHQIIMITRR